MEQINKKNAKIFSFDVFDTTLIRRTAEPKGIFLLMQKKLSELRVLPQFIVDDFSSYRINAEILTRQENQLEEVTLLQIYTTFAEKFSLPIEVRDLLINFEQEEELKNVLPVPKILQVIRMLRDSKKRIIFTSDTYLPKDLIESMLKKVGAFKTGDKLYVSSEYFKTKASGNLFKIILNKERCSTKDLVHVGDNPVSDVKSGKKIGVHTIQFKDTNLTRYECAILEGGKQNNTSYIWQVVAGASRVARLTIVIGEREKALQTLGANVAGPLLVPYVIWVLKQANVLNIKRLYFLSRDGQILLEIALRLNEVLGIETDLRYLYGSRQAWHLPAMLEIGEKELSWLLLADPIISLRIFAVRTGLEPRVVQKQVLLHGMNIELDDSLNKSQVQRLHSIIFQSELHDLIIAKANHIRSDVLQYFAQEELMDNVSWGLVDMGWHGNMQESLTKILKTKPETGNISIHGFYFGLLRSSREATSYSAKHAFFFDKHTNNSSHGLWHIRRALGTQYSSLLEIFTAANHGTTLAYSKSGNKWHPVLKENTCENFEKGGLESLRDGIFAFLEAIPSDILRDLATEIDLKYFHNRLLLIIELLYRKPSYMEAAALGSYLFSSDQSETWLCPFAPPFNVSYIISSFRDSSARKPFNTYWLEGSLARSDSCSRFVFPFYSQFKCFLNMINR